MESRKLLLFTALVAASVCSQAQKNDVPTSTTSAGEGKNINMVKFNVTALAIKNYSLQYERTLNRKFSAAVSFRYMPTTSLPFKTTILNAMGDEDPDTKDIIDNFKLSNIAITPEVRLYLSKKGYGRGFYIAPFYRYASFKTNNLLIDYTNDQGSESNINLSGKLTSNTAGILFGAQWALGKHLVLDWWILGPHYGSANGAFTGITSETLSQMEQNEPRKQLDDLDIPLVDKKVDVDSHGLSLTLDGPWAGVRGGLSLGVRF